MTNSTGKDENVFRVKLARRARSAKKMRVLAVDDDTSILQLLSTALSAFDFEVTTASSGSAALKLADEAETPFDCLLLDIQMPEINGILLCQELRKRPDYAEAPIIMLTAMSDRKYVDVAFVAGATDYVTKPFDFQELRSRMSAARRLVQERAKAADEQDEMSHVERDSVASMRFNLDEPISIPEIDRVLRYAEFDNYIMQLSQGRLFNSYATGLKILDAKSMHGDLSPTDFRRVLHDVASCIAELTKKTGDIICYRGNGVFLVVTHGRIAAEQPLDEATLNRLLASVRGGDNPAACPQVLVGERVSLRSLSKSGALMSVSKAIENVELREQARVDNKKIAKRVFWNRSLSSDEAHVKKRAYESVLRDLIRDEPSLGSD